MSKVGVVEEPPSRKTAVLPDRQAKKTHICLTRPGNVSETQFQLQAWETRDKARDDETFGLSENRRRSALEHSQ